MKKHMTRNIILMLVLDVILGIVLALYISSTGTVPAADNADTYTDGTYTASAQGCLSEVGVTVTITGGWAARRQRRCRPPCWRLALRRAWMPFPAAP